MEFESYDALAFRWAYGFESNLERNILVSIECYQVALSGLRSKTEEGNIYKRLGNSSNELGVFYMNTAMSMINDTANEPVLRCLEELWKKSGARLSCGIEAFDKIGDSVNVGLVNANLGRLMRLCAQSHAELQGGGREFTPQERHCYLKAASYYLTAREKLQSREACTDIWDSISWELSSTYFNMATQLQDYAPLSSHSREEVEKEVTDCMTKALKYCDLDTQTAQLPVRQYRGATIQHRLASLYHNAFRGQLPDCRRVSSGGSTCARWQSFTMVVR
ncbi:PREDICTED: erythroid differentiation-related factor 1-like [Priapulus caudatus]|uniref:Erythroid differentiation-related factor 1-like n=1 Tax=Priapulus caudatus TaxID=37621 RepID=A0ABM1F603_PRICU|nr:PREDICTED: erythroid differentiation-related factor 1-like [Priapulus caudatus]